MIARIIILLLALLVAACNMSKIRRDEQLPSSSSTPTRGGFYQDDGPGDNIPANLDGIPDAVPRAEPPNPYTSRPYSVLGRDYVPLKPGTPYRATGIASWYGKKFHGQKTASGEIYDMYTMTAAHPTLPIPSYARVTNPANGKSVTVRVNDRGPFLYGRLIDLSYAAAYKLGYVNAGSAQVVVESITPGVALPPVAVVTPPAVTVAPATLPIPTPVAVTAPTTSDNEDTLAKFLATADAASHPLPEITDARGIYLQLGAFSNAGNADNLRLRLARELGSLGDRLAVSSGSGIYRVQLGPWSDRAEAQRIARQLEELLTFRPFVVTY
jgi:rare lipoprotein A